MKLLLLVLSIFVVSFAQASYPELETVERVELNRYLGKWYEIARFEQSFQKDCTAVTAEYKLRKNGTIKVTNTCRKFSPDGELKVATGRARVSNKDTNAKLKVQFFLRFLNIGFLSGDYWVLALGDNYEYAMVGDPSRKYLWILSRTNKLDERTYLELVQKAETLGFNTAKLLKTIH
jgi:apolipoprotein D and lipocalin family protein